VTISPEGKITDVNEATETATGVSRRQLVGADFSDYFTEPDLARNGYRRVLSEGFVTDYALTIRHVSGRTIDVLYNAVVYKNAAGEAQGVFAAARDVTERRRIERELNKYRAHLEELVQQRASQLEADANQFLFYIVDGVTRMQQLITDLLNYCPNRAETIGFVGATVVLSPQGWQCNCHPNKMSNQIGRGTIPASAPTGLRSALPTCKRFWIACGPI